MLSVKDLSIETLKGRKLIGALSFVLNPGDKMAVIGEEGNGKSTLLKAIFDKKLIEDYAVVKGDIQKAGLHLGYIEQKLNPSWDDHTVMEYFLMDSPFGDVDYDKYNQINEIKNVLNKLNFNTDRLDDDNLIKTLSGGEKVKLQIAKLMIDKLDTILLDEPTNDLDIETIEILERFILNTNAPIMFISHDETLLENTANIILHIEQLIKKTQPKVNLKRARYSEYIAERSRDIQHQTQMAQSQQRERDKKEEILRNIKQKVENNLNTTKDSAQGRILAKKMASVKALERRYDSEEVAEVPDVEEAINLLIDENITVPKQKRILDLDLDQLKVGDNVLARNVHLEIVGPERVAIIGKNGSGKSTLIKQIVPVIKNTPGLKVGYFAQNYSDILDYNATPVEALSSLEQNPRTMLGCLKFTREEMTHQIKDLSEGQKAKIAIAKLIGDKNNVLIMDEPTRNLSPLTNPVIRELLKKYKGVIIVVSHDRKFIHEICDKVYELTSKALKKIEKL